MSTVPPPSSSSPPGPVYQTPPPPPKSNTARNVLIGCLAAFVLCVVICAGGTWWVFANAKRIVTSGIQAASAQIVRDSKLPEDEKQQVIAQLDRVANEFKAGRIDADDLARVMERIVESPLIPVGMVYWAQQQYVAPSQLSQQEKDEAMRTLERYGRGLYEKTIPQSNIEQVTAPLTVIGPDGKKQLKPNPTTEELKQFLELVEQQADAANVPDEPFKVDIGDEIEKAVDAALQAQP